MFDGVLLFLVFVVGVVLVYSLDLFYWFVCCLWFSCSVVVGFAWV